MKSTELKAQVYDLIAQSEQHQLAQQEIAKQIQDLNKQITEALEAEKIEKEKQKK